MLKISSLIVINTAIPKLSTGFRLASRSRTKSLTPVYQQTNAHTHTSTVFRWGSTIPKWSAVVFSERINDVDPPLPWYYGPAPSPSVEARQQTGGNVFVVRAYSATQHYHQQQTKSLYQYEHAVMWDFDKRTWFLIIFVCRYFRFFVAVNYVMDVY